MEAEQSVAMEIFPGPDGPRPPRPHPRAFPAMHALPNRTSASIVIPGDNVELVEEAYGLSRDQVLAALRYAAHIAAHLPPAVRQVS